VHIVKIERSNCQPVIKALEEDYITHVFAIYDLQYDLEHAIMHAAYENETLNGYVLTYTALDFPSVILECNRRTATKLINYTPKNHFIIHCPPNLLALIQARFPTEKHYVEDWMLVKEGEANSFKSEKTRKLQSENDASRLADLLATREDRPKTNASKCYNLISKMPTYGVFIGDELVSYAGSFIQMPQIWMIGGVYTHPESRNKGYATLATSAVTEEALRNAETAALFARTDNYPAVRAYEKIGYRKIGEKLWIDVGTAMKP
jgi:RimJ/RimL family protein N-acetyltransferase